MILNQKSVSTRTRLIFSFIAPIIGPMILLFASEFAVAQTCPGSLPAGMDCVAAGATTDITAYTICARITNSHASGKAIMIPQGSTGEWLAFRTNAPAGITVAGCAASCSGYTIGASCVGNAVYAGELSGVKYMTTAGGCTDSATPTCAGGTDTVTKIWGASTYGINTGATSVTDGDGNTTILKNGWSDTYAARFCDAMVFEGFSDWFLPARSEVAMLYTNRVAIGGFTTAGYLSSSDAAPTVPNFAWRINFSTGALGNWNKTLDGANVRCMRKL